MDQKRLFQDFGYSFSSQGENILGLQTIKVLELLGRHGVVAFREFELNIDLFREFTNSFTARFLNHAQPKMRPNLSEDKSIVGVLAGSDDVRLHGEMYYGPSSLRPDLIWFYCIVPPRDGGATTFCDGVKFLEALSAKTRELFETKPIVYRIHRKQESWHNQFGTADVENVVQTLRSLAGISGVRVNPDQSIDHIYTTSAITRTRYGSRAAFVNSIENIVHLTNYSGGKSGSVSVEFADGSPISKSLLAEIHDAGETCTEELIWKANDLVMVDNSRILHGRRGFKGERKIATRFSIAA